MNKIMNDGARLGKPCITTVFSSLKPTKTNKKCIYNSKFQKTRKTNVDNYLLNKHIKFQKDRMNNEGARLGKL